MWFFLLAIFLMFFFIRGFWQVCVGTALGVGVVLFINYLIN